MQQPIFEPPVDPFVDRNPFRQRQYKSEAIPTFAEARPLLPEPILPQRPELVEMYWRAWEIAWTNLHRPKAGSGFVSNYIDAAFHINTFMWDSAFMVLFAIYARRAINLMSTLDNFYAKQHDNGFICREINTSDGSDFFTPYDPNSTGPNILAWTEWRYYRLTGDDGRLAEVFWPLLAYHRWYRLNRTWPNGLYWATGLSSGMDNQTRVPQGQHHHRHWTWVDANLQALLDTQILSQMANLLGEEKLASELNFEAFHLQQEINSQLWNPETSFYQDIDAAGNFSPVKSIGAYWALLSKDLFEGERLVPFLRHLRETAAFNRPHRVPSQSADSPGYDVETGDYWRGGVWPGMNYVVLKGLQQVGHYKLANDIAANHINMVSEVFQHSDTFWENYAPEQAAPSQPSRKNFIGMTGVSPISILLEDFIGLKVDWPLRRVIWDLHQPLDQTYGVKNYPLGSEGHLDLLAEGKTVRVTSDVPFTLVLRDSEQSMQTAVPVGTTEIAR